MEPHTDVALGEAGDVRDFAVGKMVELQHDQRAVGWRQSTDQRIEPVKLPLGGVRVFRIEREMREGGEMLQFLQPDEESFGRVVVASKPDPRSPMWVSALARAPKLERQRAD